MKKKILSLVLTVLMVIGLMPGFTLNADAIKVTNFYLITNGLPATANYHVYRMKNDSATEFVPISSNADMESNTAYSTIEKAMAEIADTVDSGSATLYFAEQGTNLGNTNGVLDIGDASVKLGKTGTYTINGGLTSSNDGGTIELDGASLIVSGKTTSVVNTEDEGVAIHCTGSVSVRGGTIQAKGASGDAIRHDGAGTIDISGGKIISLDGTAIAVESACAVTVSGAEWNETAKTGTLVRSDGDGSFAIGLDAEKGVWGTLTVNGGTVSGRDKAIGGLLGVFTINGGKIIGETGAAMISFAGTINVNGGEISSGNANTDVENYPGAIWLSDMDMGNANLYLKGGSVENTAAGCPAVYCCQAGNTYTPKVFLSGTPSVSGTADIWTNTPIYADDGAPTPVNYTGSQITMEYGGTTTAGVTVAVAHVSSGVNDTLFAISNPGYTLHKSGSNLVIGEPSATKVTLSSGSFGTADNGKITGLASGSIYKVTADTAVYYVKADGTLSSKESDAAPLAGTEITGLTNGTTYKVEPYTPGGGGGGGGGDGSHKPSKTDKTEAADGASVVVDGKTQTAGTAQTKEENGKKTTTVTIGNDDVETVMKNAGNNATLKIPVAADCDKAVGRLDGQAVKYMEKKEAVIAIDTGSVSYTLPASEINIDAVSAQLGNSVALKDIAVDVSISGVSDKTAKIVENAAANGGYSIMVPAVEFTVNCTSNGKTVEVRAFNSYVERMIAIPDGIDPNKITTGIVVEPDGSIHHVPTEIILESGKYYAKINSLTNSVYSIIYNPVEFADVAKHWAKNAINDMGSRLVVSGKGNNCFDPGSDITRAEFAAIVVRALGLEPGTGDNNFRDVKAGKWYCDYIRTASSYGIITGYDADSFGPNDTISREQAMAMIARAMKITGLEANLGDSETSSLLAGYTDSASAAVYAKESIAKCLKAGVVTGTGSNTITPKADITRAEVAVIVQRLLDKSELI